jgi:hypothetical protein
VPTDWQAAPPPPAGSVRQRADDILSRSEFQHHQSLVSRVLDWIGDQLNRFSFGVGRGPGFVGDLVGLVLIAAAVFIVIVLVRSLRRTPRTVDEVELSIEEEESRSAADWRSDAERFETEQRWREALRARYRELLRTLVEDGVLVDLPGRTTGEYRVELRTARPSTSEPFAELTDLFERAWYGGRLTGPDEYRRFRELVSVVRERTRDLVATT